MGDGQIAIEQLHYIWTSGKEQIWGRLWEGGKPVELLIDD